MLMLYVLLIPTNHRSLKILSSIQSHSIADTAHMVQANQRQTQRTQVIDIQALIQEGCPTLAEGPWIWEAYCQGSWVILQVWLERLQQHQEASTAARLLPISSNNNDSSSSNNKIRLQHQHHPTRNAQMLEVEPHNSGPLASNGISNQAQQGQVKRPVVAAPTSRRDRQTMVWAALVERRTAGRLTTEVAKPIWGTLGTVNINDLQPPSPAHMLQEMVRQTS